MPVIYDMNDAGEVLWKFYRNNRKFGRPMGHDAPHIPNKAERKLLTTMMRDSGQTEEQVRASLTNRQKLATAAKSMSAKNPNSRRSKMAPKASKS